MVENREIDFPCFLIITVEFIALNLSSWAELLVAWVEKFCSLE